MNSIHWGSITSVFLLIGCQVSFAQIDLSKYEIGISGSAFVYQGDLTPSLSGSLRTVRPGAGILVNRFLNHSFSVRANFSYGMLKGDDALYASPVWRRERNFNFSTPLFETSVLAVWNVLGKNGSANNHGFAPYLFAGVGYSFLNIKRDWSRMNISYFAGETGTLNGLARDTTKHLSNSIPVLPIGVGVRYAVNEHFSIFTEWSYRITFTDYLDGFSYAANPSKKDYYHSLSLGIVYTFHQKNYMDCPVIKR
ncbi:MAG TPA: DUF6089 family protein [Puia sp.]|nr:DUF6089 family protein [Puia sp.]